MTKQEAYKLARDHWEYTEKLLKQIYSEDLLFRMGELYMEAMVHGVKHAQGKLE